MKLTASSIKELIRILGYIPEDGCNDIYYKQYTNHNNYTIKVNFETEKLEYRNADILEENGIKWGDTTTSNFENSENFVVFECVDRLLEKGYEPKSLTLEKKYPLGRNLKGKLDIVVTDDEDKPFLMIECKTWGGEYEKELKKMINDGGQLFSYYVKDKAAKYLCLYASQFANQKIEYRNDIVPVDEAWLALTNDKEIHDHWNKNFKDNGIFEDWANAYDIEIKALVRGRLEELTQEDSGRIFNQFAEILRHNVVSDKPNAFNKILNLFICKIIDEDRNESDQVEFQWIENDTDESLQARLNDLYKKGMHRFLDIDVTDYSDDDISNKLTDISDKAVMEEIKAMFAKLRLQKNPEFAFMEVYNDQSFKANSRVVREVVELLQPYQFRYGHKQQFLGDFFELLLNTSIKQEAGQFFTPVPITRFIVSSLPIKEFILNKLKNDNPEVLPVVIDYATGSGHFLTEYMDQVQNIIENIEVNKAIPSARKKINVWRGEDAKYEWAKEYVYGIELDYRLVKTSKVSSFLNGDGEANIIRANGLDHFANSEDYRGKLREVSNEDPKDNGQFDILIANPPYSVNAFKSTVKYGEDSFELFNRLSDNSSEIECLFIERTKQLLKVGGWAGIILPSSILSNTGIYTATREIILKYFNIKAITEFGSNTFMATGTNTITLFLERRPNNDHKLISNAIHSFFERPKEATVLGIEKAFSKYVSEVFDGISLDDYISFASKKPTEQFKKLEIFRDYINWFNGLTETKILKDKKSFKEMIKELQKSELEKLFYSKVFEIEKDKILYFLLTYPQQTVIIKVGEKQEEKDFIGYEFSNRRGHEGIRMLPNGTKLYDEYNPLNPEKANSYIYNAFLGNDIKIDETIQDNVSIFDTFGFFDFKNCIFEKVINLSVKKKHILNSKWDVVALRGKITAKGGDTFPKEYQGNKNSNDIPFNKVSDMNTKENFKYISVSNNYITNEVASSILKTTIFPKGSVVFPKVGMAIHTNKKRILARNSCIDNNIICISATTPSNLSNRYLYEYFNFYVDLRELCSTANPPSISSEKLFEYKIPLPPIDVQQKIVYEIESVENLEQNSKIKVEELKNSQIKAEYFNYPDERINKIAIMVKRGKSSKYGKSNIQIIKSGQARGYSEFDFSQRYYVSDGFISDERNLVKGDILINSTGVGTAGRVTLFDLNGDFVVDSHITIVRLDQTKALPKYVLYAFANFGFKNIEKMANGQSGQIEISLPIINNMRIPLPPINKQKDIISEIEVIEAEIKRVEAEIADIEDKKKQILIKYL